MKPAKDAHEKGIRAALKEGLPVWYIRTQMRTMWYESEDFELLERILGEKRIPQQAELF